MILVPVVEETTVINEPAVVGGHSEIENAQVLLLREVRTWGFVLLGLGFLHTSEGLRFWELLVVFWL